MHESKEAGALVAVEMVEEVMGDVEETEVAVEAGGLAVDVVVAEAADPADRAVEEAGPTLEEVEVEMDAALDTLD